MVLDLLLVAVLGDVKVGHGGAAAAPGHLHPERVWQTHIVAGTTLGPGVSGVWCLVTGGFGVSGVWCLVSGMGVRVRLRCVERRWNL